MVISNDPEVRRRRWRLAADMAVLYVHLDDIGVIGVDRSFLEDVRENISMIMMSTVCPR